MAQPKSDDRADIVRKKVKIQAIKAAYITEELELTVAESQAFWPVYNELQEKEHELRDKQRSDFKKLTGDGPSEKEAEKILYSFADTHIAIEELRKSYIDDFIEVVGAKKTAKLLLAEKEFGRRIMERMKGKNRSKDRTRIPLNDLPVD